MNVLKDGGSLEGKLFFYFFRWLHSCTGIKCKVDIATALEINVMKCTSTTSTTDLHRVEMISLIHIFVFGCAHNDHEVCEDNKGAVEWLRGFRLQWQAMASGNCNGMLSWFLRGWLSVRKYLCVVSSMSRWKVFFKNVAVVSKLRYDFSYILCCVIWWRLAFCSYELQWMANMMT